MSYQIDENDPWISWKCFINAQKFAVEIDKRMGGQHVMIHYLTNGGVMIAFYREVNSVAV